jgi:hypothetical protein
VDFFIREFSLERRASVSARKDIKGRYDAGSIISKGGDDYSPDSAALKVILVARIKTREGSTIDQCGKNRRSDARLFDQSGVED